jgi:hypothetical protein
MKWDVQRASTRSKLALACVVSVACGGGSNRSVSEEAGTLETADAAHPGSASSPSSPPAGSSGVFENDAAPVGITDGGANGSCASTVVEAQNLPLMLVFMFDRSGSMSDLESSDGGPKQSKWAACSAGLDAFFADPASAGISASLQFFMGPDECNVDAYATPQVPMTSLPNSTVFANAIAATMPNGETPTVPALEGALKYAAATQKGNPGAKVAVVLVTDGEPNGCNSSIPDAADAATGAASSTPTYVVGIGKVKNLDAIAMAGGTGQAFIVSTSNPTQTAVDFGASLAKIRGSSLGCEYQIPAAPAGQTLDFNAVNLVFTPSGGTPETLLYDKDCAGSGWHYDDPLQPTKIEICPASCTTIQGDIRASINLELGCATQGGPR